MQNKTVGRIIQTCFFVLVFILYCFSATAARAEITRFSTDYIVDYYLTDNGNSIATQVSFKVKISNKTSDLIVKDFSLQFPKSFQIGNIKANDDFKEILPRVNDDKDGNHVISVEFSDPQAGLNTQNTIYLNFLQYNLFKINGNVWEVILPTIDNRNDGGNYTVTVHLPAGSNKKISIAKPKPDNITINDIVWKNPANKTIYAVFGDQQNYALDLRYHLTNPGMTKVYTDIAFPPDTEYQQVYVNSIQPQPASITVDSDGNYLGRYYLNPKENKTIYFKGGVVVYTEPRMDMIAPIKKLFMQQKKYLLSTTKDWTILPNQLPGNLHTINDIYGFTMKTLTYNYARVNSNVTRLGATKALEYPDQAVCTEYSDVLITLSRENGIYSREIQGYGFSNDQNLRPLSVNSDVLHSWSEFYDMSTGLWHQLDPTWEDTSGIDYFHSFDLNHIVFAIHGKDSDYPYPAGSYKTKDSMKDINILATSDAFPITKKLAFHVSPLQIPGLTANTFTMKVNVQNTGNTFVWDAPFVIVGDNLAFKQAAATVDVLAPYQTKELTFEYSPSKLASTSRISIISNGQKVFEQQVPITSSYFMVIKFALIGIVLLLVVMLIVKLIKR